MPPFANPNQQPPAQPGMGIPGTPQQPQPQDPVTYLMGQVQQIWKTLQQYEANQQQMVAHINKWVAKIQGIDSVAFAALALHDGKEFKLSKEKAAEVHDAITAVLQEMGRYRDERAEEAKAAQEQTTTPILTPDKPKILTKKDPGILLPSRVKRELRAKKEAAAKETKDGTGNDTPTKG